ncbi:DUF6893 family small protein [Streptomyces sp. NPDC054887]
MKKTIILGAVGASALAALARLALPDLQRYLRIRKM